MQKTWRLIGLVLLLVSACRSVDNGGTPTTASTSPIPAKGVCGDGICDAAEQANPALCPQDCPETASTSSAKGETQPNIVFILTDDLDTAGIEYMPQLKSLIADQGVTFSNFLISMPLCCPSRATILRGQYGHNTQIMGNDLPFGGFFKFSELGEEDSTCATWLQEAGYRTMLAGKYLNAFPDSNDLMHIPPGWSEWYSPILGEAFTQYNYTLNENGQQVAYGEDPEDYGTDVYARNTIDFIQRSLQDGVPFFVHVSVYAPHTPTTPAPRHADLLANAQAPRPPNFNEQDVSDKPSYIRNLDLLTEEEIQSIDEEWRERLRSMQAVDEMIADIVEILEANGQLDNTYIFFTSDNGYHHGNHRQMLGKTSPYDEEILVPLIVRGPGVPSGVKLEHLSGNTDLASTWADIAGVSAPDFVDGRSLLPLLREDPPPLSEWRQSFLIEHAPFQLPHQSTNLNIAYTEARTPAGLLEPPDPEDQFSSGTLDVQWTEAEAPPYRGIRTKEYIYIEYPTDEKELYDLRSDPYQLENIYSSADPNIIQELADRLEELAACSAATCLAIENKPFTFKTEATTTPEVITPRTGTASEPLIYYLGYATEENLNWIETFDADILTRGFLLFLNSSDSWLTDYKARMQLLQSQGRLFLAALQAAVLVEHGSDLPRLGSDDPTLDYATVSLPQWEQFACRTADGLTLIDKGSSFAHACINNADFQAFFLEKLRELVEAGADGVHIDQLSTLSFLHHEGYCQACMDGLRAYLAKKYSPEQLNSMYAIDDIATFDFRERLQVEGNLQNPQNSPLHKEWWLYQLSNLNTVESELFSATRSYAQSLGKDFIITSNAYEPEINPQHVIEMTMTDIASIGTGMSIMLRREGSLVSTLRVPPNISYIPLYRMAQALTPNKPVTLFIDGPEGTSVIKDLPEEMQKNIIRWMFAEAYSTGARFHVPYPSLDYYAPLEDCQQYTRFILDNRAVFEAADHLIDVGVLFSYASEIWSYWAGANTSEINHSLQYYGLAQALTNLGVQFDVVFAPDGTILPNNLSLNDLLPYDTLIIPWAFALNDSLVGMLEEYVRRDKELIVLGDFATFDEQKNSRPADAVVSLRNLGASVVPGLNFENYLNDPSGQNAAHLLDALNDLIPDRLVTIADAPVTVQLNRKGNALYVHLINQQFYESRFIPQQNIKLSVTLPVGASLSELNAIYISPEASSGEQLLLPIVQNDGSVEIIIPDLEIYAVVMISLVD